MKLMTHLVAGYPSLAESEKIALALARSGAALLEIQFPFSDPVADGPVIAAANATALKNGVTVKNCFAMVRRVAARAGAPVLIMTYFNIVFAAGAELFCRRARAAGAAGLIVPDYPCDEESSNHLIRYCKKYRLDFIPVIAPNTRPDRLKTVLRHGSGFVYCVARRGTTGKKTAIDPSIAHYLKRVRLLTRLPLAVGFGLSEKAQLTALQPHADIAVIGTALMAHYDDIPGFMASLI